MTSVSSAYQTRTPTRSSAVAAAAIAGTYRTPNKDVAQRLTGTDIDRIESSSATKARIDIQVKDIQTLLDNKYSAEMSLWNGRLREAETHRQFLEEENLRISEEIMYLKSKASQQDADRLANSYTSEALRASQIDSLRSTGDASSVELRFEADRLRSLLNQKVEECNEIKANYSKLEILNAENREKNEVAQDYEVKIMRLKDDYNLRLIEVEELRNKRNRLEADNVELQRAEREADNLKNLLDAKRNENSRIRKERTEMEVEIYKTKKAEAALLEKEALLKNKIHSLEGEAAVTEELRNSRYFEKQQTHALIQNELRRSFHAEANSLENAVNDRQRLAALKGAEVDSLRRSYHELNANLSRAEDDSVLANSEARVWREKTTEADRLKEAEIARANRLKEASISLTLKDNQRERIQLEERVDTLNKVVSYKDQDLNQARRENDLTQSEKRLLENDRLKLKIQLDDLIKKQDESERRFQQDMRTRDNLHSFSVEKIRKDHDNEKRRVGNQISAIRNVIDIKSQEADRARRQASGFQLQLIECDNKARVAEGQSSYWRNETDRVARQRDLEYSVEKSLTHQQLRDLDRSQSIEKLQKLKEAETIKGVIHYKEREALDLRTQQARTAADIASEKYLKSRLQTEAEINRSRALDIERNKHHELIVRDIAHNGNVDSLRRSGQIESAVLRTEVNHLSDSLVRKDIEARSWRDGYSRIATSPYQPAVSPYRPAVSPYRATVSPYTSSTVSPYTATVSPYRPTVSPYRTAATSPYRKY